MVYLYIDLKVSIFIFDGYFKILKLNWEFNFWLNWEFNMILFI